MWAKENWFYFPSLHVEHEDVVTVEFLSSVLPSLVYTYVKPLEVLVIVDEQSHIQLSLHISSLQTVSILPLSKFLDTINVLLAYPHPADIKRPRENPILVPRSLPNEQHIGIITQQHK